MAFLGIPGADMCQFVKDHGGIASVPQVCGSYPINASGLSPNMASAFRECSGQVARFAAADSCHSAAAAESVRDGLNSPLGISLLGYVFWQGMRLAHRSMVLPSNPRAPYRRFFQIASSAAVGGGLIVASYALGGPSVIVAAVGMAIIYGVNAGRSGRAGDDPQEACPEGSSVPAPSAPPIMGSTDQDKMK